MPSPMCAIIIVTHNSEKYVQKAMESVHLQTRQADQVILVDSGSADTSYLDAFARQPNAVVVLSGENVGFCQANNLGMQKLHPAVKYVLFLNPDAMLSPSFLEEAICYMELPQQQPVGALTGTIFGYNIEENHPSGRYDSTGVFQRWYGRWFDRGQGQSVDPGLYSQEESIPAICGAVFFCRKKALDSVLLREKEVFDKTFYMYKDDIDLSSRLRSKGWELKYVPSLAAYHCRGWQSDRRQMPRAFRLCSAWNELRIHMRAYQPIPVAYSLCKYVAVKLFDR